MRTHIGEILLKVIRNVVDGQNAKGYDKYNETLDDVEFEEYDWNAMALEEMVDGMQYMIKENERLKEQLRELKDGKEMKVKDYQSMCARTMPQMYLIDGKAMYSDMDKLIFALGLTGEAGELGEIVKKLIGHGHAFDRDKFIEEAGDVSFYLNGLCEMFGVSMEEVNTNNQLKLMKRYPNGFNSEDSIKRADKGYTSSFQDDMNNMYKVDVKA